jgi:hypothetical protein
MAIKIVIISLKMVIVSLVAGMGIDQIIFLESLK